MIMERKQLIDILNFEIFLFLYYSLILILFFFRERKIFDNSLKYSNCNETRRLYRDLINKAKDKKRG